MGVRRTTRRTRRRRRRRRRKRTANGSGNEKEEEETRRRRRGGGQGCGRRTRSKRVRGGAPRRLRLCGPRAPERWPMRKPDACVPGAFENGWRTCASPLQMQVATASHPRSAHALAVVHPMLMAAFVTHGLCEWHSRQGVQRIPIALRNNLGYAKPGEALRASEGSYRAQGIARSLCMWGRVTLLRSGHSKAFNAMPHDLKQRWKTGEVMPKALERKATKSFGI